MSSAVNTRLTPLLNALQDEHNYNVLHKSNGLLLIVLFFAISVYHMPMTFMNHPTYNNACILEKD